MRLTALILAGLLFTTACGRDASAPETKAPEVLTVSAPVSDELPGLPGAATGIAFWDHPTLSFNGVMIVATKAGVVSYSMEDGNVVSRIGGFAAEGLATGYLGAGRQAAGFIAFLDSAENTFRFYGVDNNTRAFLPLNAGPVIRGAVRGFCLGRAQDATAPSLFVVQKGGIQTFNLAASPEGVEVESQSQITAPDNLVSCAVDLDGALLAAGDNGDIYKLAGDEGFAAPFARSAATSPGAISVLAAADSDDPSVISGLILLSGLENGAVHVFNRDTGEALGAVVLEGTDDLPAVGEAQSFGATGGNLGALYRNGVVAFGVEGAEGEAAIRLAPASTVKNALSLPLGEPVSPRGEAADTPASDLIIPISIVNPE